MYLTTEQVVRNLQDDDNANNEKETSPINIELCALRGLDEKTLRKAKHAEGSPKHYRDDSLRHRAIAKKREAEGNNRGKKDGCRNKANDFQHLIPVNAA